MPYQNINNTEILSGEPVTATTLGKVKNNLDDHETRINALQGGASTTYPPLILSVNGPYQSLSGFDGLVKTTINFPITVIGVRLLVDKAGTSGTTTVDVEYKRGAGAWTSILSTKPSLSSASGSDSLSTNGVVNTLQDDLLAGDLLRVNLDSAQVGGFGFLVRIDYVKS